MKTRTRTLKRLDPRTNASLTGSWQWVSDDSRSIAKILTKNKDFSAKFQAKNASTELIELIEVIRHCQGIPTLKETYDEAISKLGLVTQVAVAVDDQAFPSQLEFAMEYARNPALTRRRAVFKAWKHLTSGNRIRDEKTGEIQIFENPRDHEIQKLAEEFFGEKILVRLFDDDLKVMQLDGFKDRKRGNAKKA